MGVANINMLKTGTEAPSFTALLATDGRRYGLTDFADKKVLVVIFSCNHCPYVQGYEDRIIALQNDFKAKGVQFIAINANDDENYPEDGYDEMKKRASEKKFNFVYLRDDTQEVAKAYGATHTPQLFVFDSNRKLAYTGRIDDNHQIPSDVKERYLRDVLLALIEGKKSPYEATFAIGCTIKWKTPK